MDSKDSTVGDKGGLGGSTSCLSEFVSDKLKVLADIFKFCFNAT